MERIGILKPNDMSGSEMIEHAKIAEAKGFESVWVAEDYYFRDAIGPASALSVVTNKVKIGIGVINLYTRTPANIAMTTASLDEISNQRTVLGIGTSLPWGVEQQGYKFRNNLARIREGIEIIRRLLAGENVTYSGRVFKIRDAQLSFKPPRAKVPIYVAAMGPLMLQLAGEIADGVVLSAGAPLEYMKMVSENVAIGAERAGRNPEEVDIVGNLVLSASEDRNAAREAVKSVLIWELANDIFDRLIEGSGRDLGPILSVRKIIERGDIEEAKRKMTDEIIDLVAVAGTPRECKSKVEKFRAAGLKLPIIFPTGDVNAAILAVV